MRVWFYLNMFRHALALILLTCSVCAAESKKPNVVFFFADDMRSDSIGALGNPVVKTPHLDSLVERGMVFRNAYCLGGNIPAVCTPSRNMLLSGQSYFRWKDFQPPKGAKGTLAPGTGPNWPISMREAGYATYHQGKRGNTALLIQQRFEVDRYIDEKADRKDGEPGKIIADDATQFLKEQKDGRPFFLYLAFANPHDPRVAAPHYLDLYDRDKIPLPKNVLPQHPFDNGEMAIRDEKLLPWPRTPEALRQTHQEYYAVITAMDRYIGQVLKTLEELKQLENTIVIFSADQGISIGSHGLLGKQNLYDAGMKSPLILAGPGVSKGQTDALVYLLDLYPTICDLAGVPIPAGLDGQSFKPVLQGQATTARRELFLSYRSVQRAVRDERWKLIRYPEINRSQLFDLQNDPDEIHDLAAEPAQAARVQTMLGRLAEWQKHYTDDLPLTSANPKPAAWTPPVEPTPAQ